MEILDIATRRQRHGPMLTLPHCEITPEHGVARDTRGKPGKRQVTLLSAAAWDAACETTGVALAWTARRANILVSGRPFTADDVGKYVYIGDVCLEITRETDPCAQMDKAQPGLQAALQPDWRGGLCCRVLTGGAIAVGDKLELLGDVR